MKVDVLKHVGTEQSSSDLWKTLVKIGASWSEQCFRVDGETPAGPRAFLTFCPALHCCDDGLVGFEFLCLNVRSLQSLKAFP